MKIIKGFLYMLLGLFVLLCALVLLFAFNPNLTDKLAGLLYGNGQTEESTEAANELAGAVQVAEEQVATSHTPSQEVEENDSAATEGMPERIHRLPDKESYVQPDEAQIKPPRELTGKTGFQPITPDEQEVQDQEGQQLADSLGYGETGDGLSFDETMYPYYNMLDDTLKHLYRQIYANANALNQSFAPIEDVSPDQLKNAFTAVFCDQPQLFWLDTAYGCKYTPSGKCVELDLQFNQTSQNLDSSKAAFNEMANQIVSAASGAGSNYDKEVSVHNAVLDRNTYNLNAPLNQSAYSALVNGQTVCAGYARAFQYAMQQLGIPCYYCMGYAGESHAWNIIQLEDGYYNVDTTWDDTEPNTYDYFNKSDNDFNTSHRRTDLSIYLPACNGSKYSNLEQNPQGEAQAEPQTESQANPMDISRMASQPASSDPGRTLSDVGFSEQDVLHDLDAYYADCARKIREKGLGDYEFQNVISDRSMYNALYLSYKNQDYKSAYAEDVMEELGAQSYNLKMRIEELADGQLLLTHHVRIQ
ncbi:MAG: transglutaminase domain-containing protein [Lachnospiraceae bacterium]|nr:transglutaminase domain-containing protein [Lachnospiraceae bacterium]